MVHNLKVGEFGPAKGILLDFSEPVRLLTVRVLKFVTSVSGNFIRFEMHVQKFNLWVHCDKRT